MKTVSVQHVKALQAAINQVERQMEIAQLHGDDAHFLKFSKEHTRLLEEYSACFADDIEILEA